MSTNFKDDAFKSMKKILLPQGGTLELEYTPDFLLKVREVMEVDESYQITDQDIVAFIHGSCSKAIDKQVKEQDESKKN